MLSCFKCKRLFNEAEELFNHIKDYHKICGNSCDVQCTTCGSCFTNFSTFKIHVLNLHVNIPSPSEEIIDQAAYQYADDENICLFEEGLRKSALELACSLSSNMRCPRCETYSTIAKFKKIYVSRIIAGMKEIVSPCVQPENKYIVDQFIKVVESTLDHIQTERKLDAALKKLVLIDSLTQCDVIDIEKKKKKPRRKPRKQAKGSKDVCEVDGTNRRKRSNEIRDSEDSGDIYDTDEDKAIVEQTETDEAVITKGQVVLMPIQFQMKNFLELPNVFEKIKLNTANILQQKKLCHFIQGKVWKEKLKRFKSDQLVIPFHFYGDGVQMNNALGPHFKSGDQHLSYYSFPTIPYEYQSRLDNIFVAQLYPAKYHQLFSTEKLYNNIIDIFNSLAETGVLININGEQHEVFFVLGLYLGDNKEQNERLGFVPGFTGLHCCRYCDMHIRDIRTKVNSEGATMRNRDNYNDDVALDNVTATGVKEYSPFNRIHCFHVTESSAVDITHDLLEGMLHKSLARSILYFIEKKYFDLKYLNKRMSSMDFGEAENGNRPVPITMDHLKNLKFKMSASEMFFFTQHFTLMVGDSVRVDDPVWKHILNTLAFFDLCYLPSYGEEDLTALLSANETVNEGLIRHFNETLQHKSHLGTHYQKLTEDYGPLRYLQTIRFEGKHKDVKSYAKNTNSRLNLSYSIGRKLEYKFALRLLQREGLEDRIYIPDYVKGSIEKKAYYKRLQPSDRLTEITRTECFFAKRVIVNGIIFSLDLWLRNIESKKINQIIDVVILDRNDTTKMFAICKTYGMAYEQHYACYSVEMESLDARLSFINVQEFISEHHYPVKIHQIQNKHLFRSKSY